MREPLKDSIRFEHMLEAIDNVAQFTAGETKESLSNDKLRKHATAYNIQIIGESAYQISKERNASLMRQLNSIRKEMKDGNCTTCNTKEELDAFFDSL